MNRLAAIIFICAALPSVRAEETNIVSRLDFPSFRIISERNIFNANRYPHSSTAPRPPRIEPERRYNRPETFALLGTMSYEKGRFAFFEGSSSQYRGVYKATDNIAGFKITEVGPNSVKLANTNGQPIELPVGMQMKKQDEGEWSVTARTDTPSSLSRTASSTSSSSTPDNAEALKRLMQRREQEAGSEAATSNEPAPAAQIATPTTETPPTAEKPPASTDAGADEILKRLLQKREQELNK